MHGTAPADACLGQTRLPVADLDRAIAFYRDVLGLRVTARLPSGAALQGSGGAQPIGLSLRRAAGRPPTHAALVCPDRRALARTVARVLAAGVPVLATMDHGVSEAVYLRDPDGNGVEIHRDRPESEWPRSAPQAEVMLNRPLDIGALLAQA